MFMHPEFCYKVRGLLKSTCKIEFMLNGGLHNPGGGGRECLYFIIIVVKVSTFRFICAPIKFSLCVAIQSSNILLTRPVQLLLLFLSSESHHHHHPGCSSETLVNSYQTVWCHIPNNEKLHSH